MGQEKRMSKDAFCSRPVYLTSVVGLWLGDGKPESSPMELGLQLDKTTGEMHLVHPNTLNL
jgi:hypothetical protein